MKHSAKLTFNLCMIAYFWSVAACEDWTSIEHYLFESFIATYYFLKEHIS